MFNDPNDPNSIKLMKRKNYSLCDPRITIKEIYEVYLKNKVIYSDDLNQSKTTFIQTDSF